MQTADVIKIRDFHKNNKASAMVIVGDNMQIMSDNSEYIIWDDDNETVMALRVNSEYNTQAESPFALIITSYENIQYIKGIYRKESMIATIDKLFADAKITEKQKDILGKFVDSIDNQEVVYKNESDFYYNDPSLDPKTT